MKKLIAFISTLIESAFRAVILTVCITIGVLIVIEPFKLIHSLNWWIPSGIYVAYYILNKIFLEDIHRFKIRAGLVDGCLVQDPDLGVQSSAALGQGDLIEYAKQRSMGC